jgi:hypothetical protein
MHLQATCISEEAKKAQQNTEGFDGDQAAESA